MARYLKPSPLLRLPNAVIRRLLRRGVKLFGAHELAVRGRTSGQEQTVPVNPLRVGGDEYLVSARGEAHWVRNLRAAGQGELRHGGRARAVDVVEVADDAKPAVLRPYLKRWGWQVGAYFDGVTAKSTDAELLAAAADHPIFLVRGR